MSREQLAELVDIAAARHAAADAADRQPARERAHRVGAAHDPAPAVSRCRRSSRMRRSSSRGLLHAAQPDARGRPARVVAAGRSATRRGSRRCSSTCSRTRTSSVPRAARSASARAPRRRSARGLGGGRRSRRARAGARLDLRALPSLGGRGAGAARARPRALDRALDRRASRRHASPSSRPDDDAHALHDHACRSLETSRMKILIVDDDRDLLALVGFALRQAGYVVVEAADVDRRAARVLRRVARARDPRHQPARRQRLRRSARRSARSRASRS